MGYVLDTIVLIWAVRGRHNADAVLARLHADGDCAISAITLLELRRALAPEEHCAAEDRLAGVGVLAVDADIARAAGEYLARCADEGQRVDFFAGVIAATAERHGRALATYSPFQYPLARCELVALSTVLDDEAEA